MQSVGSQPNLVASHFSFSHNCNSTTHLFNFFCTRFADCAEKATVVWFCCCCCDFVVISIFNRNVLFFYPHGNEVTLFVYIHVRYISRFITCTCTCRSTRQHVCVCQKLRQTVKSCELPSVALSSCDVVSVVDPCQSVAFFFVLFCTCVLVKGNILYFLSIRCSF